MKNLKKKKGSSMILVIAITMAILIFSATSISAVVSTFRGNEIQIAEDDLFYIAEAGFEHGYARLMSEAKEASYSKTLDGANVQIEIIKESEKLYRVRSEAKKQEKSKIVQGVIEDKRVGSEPVKYSEIISKYVINAEGVNIGMQGSVTLQYVNSKTEVVKNPNVQVAIFEQPNVSQNDKIFTTPNLKVKHSNDIEAESMQKLIEMGLTNNGNVDEQSVVTEQISLGKVKYNIVFVNADNLTISVPNSGELIQNIILISSGNIKIENDINSAIYANISMVCNELIIANKGMGSINISPQPNIFYENQKEELDKIISKYVEPPVSNGGTIDEWQVTEMSQ